jgi:hypothetical protein
MEQAQEVIIMTSQAAGSSLVAASPAEIGSTSEPAGGAMLSGIVAAAFCLMALCVAVHAVGVTWALRRMGRHPATPQQFWRWVWLFIRLAAWIIVLHMIEITVWAGFFFWKQAMPDLQSAIYFSAATYTTTGYGDLVPEGPWRLLAGIEALTGILMSGWSTGFFFAFVSRMLTTQTTSARS